MTYVDVDVVPVCHSSLCSICLLYDHLGHHYRAEQSEPLETFIAMLILRSGHIKFIFNESLCDLFGVLDVPGTTALKFIGFLCVCLS